MKLRSYDRTDREVFKTAQDLSEQYTPRGVIAFLKAKLVFSRINFQLSSLHCMITRLLGLRDDCVGFKSETTGPPIVSQVQFDKYHFNKRAMKQDMLTGRFRVPVNYSPADTVENWEPNSEPTRFEHGDGKMHLCLHHLSNEEGKYHTVLFGLYLHVSNSSCCLTRH